MFTKVVIYSHIRKAISLPDEGETPKTPTTTRRHAVSQHKERLYFLLFYRNIQHQIVKSNITLIAPGNNANGIIQRATSQFFVFRHWHLM